MVYKDITKLENQIALFSLDDSQIYKLACIDYRGGRFDVSGQKITRWISFDNAILFNYITELDKYHELYSRHHKASKEFIYLWLVRDDLRSGTLIRKKEF